MRRLTVDEIEKVLERASRLTAADAGRGMEAGVDAFAVELAAFRAGDKLSLVDLSRVVDDFYYALCLTCDLRLLHGSLSPSSHAQLMDKGQGFLGRFRALVSEQGPGASMHEGARMEFMAGADDVPLEILQAIFAGHRGDAPRS